MAHGIEGDGDRPEAWSLHTRRRQSILINRVIQTLRTVHLEVNLVRHPWIHKRNYYK